MNDYESPLEHYSSPNGCAEDCPACEDERQHDTETQYCVIPLCEWEAVTERGERHLCAQCAQAFDAGVEYAERTPAERAK